MKMISAQLWDSEILPSSFVASEEGTKNGNTTNC